jgi:hypothetical protein
VSSRGFTRFETRVFGSYAAVRPEDLGVFRVLYAGYILVGAVPVASWVSHVPQAFFRPPLGPAALLSSPPPAAVVLAGNLVLIGFAALLLVGWRTVPASFGTGFSLIVLKSWSYSFGKIDHDILLAVAPLVLGLSGWGNRYSLDARSGRAALPRPWPLPLLALLVGFALFTAGWVKLTSGWTDPALNCTYGHLMHNFVVAGRDTWAARLLVGMRSDAAWKAADWSVVLLEVLFLPAALNRRMFCAVLAAAAVFHFGVMLAFDIRFAANVIVYGAFVRYADLPSLGRFVGQPDPTPRLVPILALALALTGTVLGHTVLAVSGAVVTLGAAAGVWYLATLPFTRRPA